MRLHLPAAYAPIQPFDLSGLTELVILTGHNGAGKTRLLSGFSSGKVLAYSTSGARLSTTPTIPATSIHPDMHRDSKAPLAFNGRDPISLTPVFRARSELDRIRKLSSQEQQRAMEESASLSIFRAAARRTSKDIISIEHSDIDALQRINPNPFYAQLGRVFTEYYRRLLKNAEAQGRATSGLSPEPYHTAEEFQKLYGPPPWEEMNQLLQKWGHAARFSAPKYGDNLRSEPITLSIPGTDAAVAVGELSSGERVLLAMLAGVYSVESDSGVFPDLVIFDELDATLHPFLIRRLLSDLIEDILIRKFGVHVLFTTHSPIAIALARSASFLLAEKDTTHSVPTTQVTLVDRETAMRKLTSDVPSLSVVFQEKRLILVEADNDRQYYEAAFAGIQRMLGSAVNLEFHNIRTVKQAGGSTTLQSAVDLLRSYGLTHAFGIRDFDSDPIDTSTVLAPSGTNRYSLENYLFDPLSLAVFLELPDTRKAQSAAGLATGESYRLIPEMSERRLQEIADVIVNKIGHHFLILDKDKEKVSCHYFRGFKLNLPKWFLEGNGHKLLSAISEAFPQLGNNPKYFRGGAGTPQLYIDMFDKVARDYPELLPKEISDLFVALQTRS